MIGKPVPELRGIAEWRGDHSLLHDLARPGRDPRNFGGYWCGPCLAAMPN